MPRAYWLKTPPPPAWWPVANAPKPEPTEPPNLSPTKPTLKDLIEQRALLDVQIRQAIERERKHF